MRKGLAGLLFVFLFMIFLPFNSYAEKCGCMGGMGEDMPMMGETGHHDDGHFMRMHLKDLGLDEKQEKAIKEIKTRVMKDSIKKRADVKVAWIDLKGMLSQDTVDMKAVEAKLKQIESLKTEIHLSHIKAMQDIKAQLTPEQREKFKNSFEERRGWPHRGKGMNPFQEEKEE